jgi:hypothetical protein
MKHYRFSVFCALASVFWFTIWWEWAYSFLDDVTYIFSDVGQVLGSYDGFWSRKEPEVEVDGVSARMRSGMNY